MIKGSCAGRTRSALDPKPLKTLVEGAHWSSAVDRPLLSAGPGRMRFRVDVEPASVSRLAVGRARLVRAAVRHHDGYFVIFGVNSFFHRPVLRTAVAYSEAAPHAQCRRDLGVGDPHCEGNQVENINETSDIMVAHDPILARLAAQIGLQDPQKPLEHSAMQAQAALQGIGDHAREGGQHGAAEEYASGRGAEQSGTGFSRKQAVPQPAETGPAREGPE